MLVTPTVAEIATDNPAVHAFETRGGTRAEDVAAMARHMEAVFDRDEAAAAAGPGGVSILLRMRDYDMGDAWASTSLATVRAQMRSPRHVARYAVVGAPPAERAVIETMRPLVPVDARTFDPEDEPAAWAFVGARTRRARLPCARPFHELAQEVGAGGVADQRRDLGGVRAFHPLFSDDPPAPLSPPHSGADGRGARAAPAGQAGQRPLRGVTWAAAQREPAQPIWEASDAGFRACRVGKSG